MKIGIIGIGNVGGVLGKRLAHLGHEVTYGVRDTGSDKLKNLLEGTQAKAGTVEHAIESSEMILIAVPWDAARDIVSLIRNRKDKVIIDCTNPLMYNTGFKELALANTTSAGEQIQEWAGTTAVIKAFNTTGSGNMENPVINGTKITMYVAGDDTDAKAKVINLVNQLGFESFDTGPLYTSRFLEPLANLWVHTAYVLGKGPGFSINITSR